MNIINNYSLFSTLLFYSLPLPQKALATLELETILPSLRILSNIHKTIFKRTTQRTLLWETRSCKTAVPGSTLAAGGQVEQAEMG